LDPYHGSPRHKFGEPLLQNLLLGWFARFSGHNFSRSFSCHTLGYRFLRRSFGAATLVAWPDADAKTISSAEFYCTIL